MKAVLSILCFIILVSCRSNDPDPYGYEAEMEKYLKEMNVIKSEAKSEFGNQMSKRMKTHPSYKAEFRAIKTEFEAYNFVQKYHKDVRDFYTRRFMDQFDKVVAQGSFVDETTRPIWLGRREEMKDVISKMMASDILLMLKHIGLR
jgi:hypothetical protein